MKDLFYGVHCVDRGYGDKEMRRFIDVMRELHSNPNVLIIEEPNRALVHVMGSDDSVIEEYLGYDSTRVRILYSGRIFLIQIISYFFFPNLENEKGIGVEFLPSRRSKNTRQIRYDSYGSYNTIASIDNWIAKNKSGFGHKSSPIDCRVFEIDATQIITHVKYHGGYREKDIISRNPIFLSSKTWNNEHKVVHVIVGDADSYGYRDSFDYDLITNRICG